jgi:hypothetical protein
MDAAVQKVNVFSAPQHEPASSGNIQGNQMDLPSLT